MPCSERSWSSGHRSPRWGLKLPKGGQGNLPETYRPMPSVRHLISPQAGAPGSRSTRLTRRASDSGSDGGEYYDTPHLDHTAHHCDTTHHYGTTHLVDTAHHCDTTYHYDTGHYYTGH